MSGLDRSLRWRAVAARHDFAAWSGANHLPSELYVAGFTPSALALAGFTRHAGRRLDHPSWPPGTRSIWRRADGGAEALLAVDTWEAPSREDAHATLVAVLEQFESPEVARRPESRLGDVAFGGAGEAVALFARGNLVVFARRAGADPVPAWGAAEAFDEVLVARPPDAGRPASLRVPAAALGRRLATGDATPLEHEPAAGEWLRIFTTTGVVSRERGDVVYRHLEERAPEVTVYRMTDR